MTVLQAVLRHENPCLSKPRYNVYTITVHLKFSAENSNIDHNTEMF